MGNVALCGWRLLPVSAYDLLTRHPVPTRKPHRGPSAYVSRARSASPRHGAPSPLSRSAEWATPRSGSPGVHGSRSVDFGRSSRQPARGRSHTSLGHARAHEPRAAGGREPKSARASLTQAKDAHHAASTNGGVSSVHSKGGGAGAEDGEEDEGEAEDLDWDVAPEQASMLREAYMAGLLADTRAFVAGRREVLAVGKTFLYVAARLEVRDRQAATARRHERDRLRHPVVLTRGSHHLSFFRSDLVYEPPLVRKCPRKKVPAWSTLKLVTRRQA